MINKLIYNLSKAILFLLIVWDKAYLGRCAVERRVIVAALPTQLSRHTDYVTQSDFASYWIGWFKVFRLLFRTGAR